MPKKPRSKLTRKEQRDLDVEIGFLEGVVQRDPKYVEALQVLGDNYTHRNKFTNKIQINEQLSKLLPNNPTILYNLACNYSLSKQIKHTTSTLTHTLNHKYKNFK